MSASNLHDSLLRPPVIQILHATGFCFAHPAVIDTLTDFAARYLLLLASTTLAHALKRHAENPTPSLDEVLLTLQDVGALELQKPQVEEELDGVEGMRGLESFLAWFSGPVNAEVMRAAGFVPSESDDEEEDMLKEDYVTGLSTADGVEDLDVQLLIRTWSLCSVSKGTSSTTKHNPWWGDALSACSHSRGSQIYT